MRDYNIPRKIRELQPPQEKQPSVKYYNIPRKIRELQHLALVFRSEHYYNIPRKIRELQHKEFVVCLLFIITYQEKSVFSDICILTRHGLIFNTTPVISALY